MKRMTQKNSQNNPGRHQTPRDNLIEKFHQANLKLQYRCAKWLERKTTDFSRKKWIVFIICFTMLSCFLNLYIVIKSLQGNASKNITIIPIVKPINSISFEPKASNLQKKISEKELKNVVRFRKYMDSLGRNPTEKTIHDSILKYHPGLLDSLTLIEGYYQSKLKK